MQRLEDFEAAIESERRRDPSGPEPDEIAGLLQRAGRDLLDRQAIHSDDRLRQTSYKLLNRYRFYFESLFDGFGYTMHYDAAYEYILLLPGEIGTGSRRGRVAKEETILLFALRVIWEEASRDGDMDDRGRIETDTQILYDRFTAMSDAEFPSKARLLSYFKTWHSRGILKMGEEDKEEELLNFTITPVIRDLVTSTLAAEVEGYLASHDTSGDVLDHLEKARRETPAGDDDTQEEDLANV